MKKFVVVVFGTTLVMGAVWGTIVYLPKLVGFMKGVRPVLNRPPQDITSSSFNDTGLPLSLPPGFSISIFAKDLPGARVMTFDPMGRLLVSLTSEGKIIALPDENVDRKADQAITVLQGLNKPHGLEVGCEGNAAVQKCTLYVAETEEIVAYDYDQSLMQATNKRKLIDLPSSSGGHFTRTIKFGPSGRLYVSIGSSCNVCAEKDERRAKIFSMNKDGSDFRKYASGLRNSVFFTWSYVDGRMWATEMGRDWLGDNLPPDEINIIEEGRNYGWPYCFGQNVQDSNFSREEVVRCSETFGGVTPSYIDLPAHSAPLGLAFIPEEGWPEDYWYNLLVAFHGSWNRSEPTGYKVVRIRLDAKGNYLGTEDFITGWLTQDGALGRPVDILVQPGGITYLSDDKAGVIYRVTSSQSQSTAPEKFVRVFSPQSGAEVSSPLVVKGEAQGSWFFEGSFPVGLLDGAGQELAKGIAQASGEWMTEDFVPFEARLEFLLRKQPREP